MKFNYFLLLFLMLALSACKKDESTNLWNISGKVVTKDAQTPEITSPLEGITVYLFNFPFTIDTTTSWFSREGILDSALTNNEGVYNFKLLAPGDYFVFPGDTTKSYNFDWIASSDSMLLAKENVKTDYEINFNALQEIPDNYCYGCFEFKFDSWGAVELNSLEYECSIVLYRKTRTWEAYWDWGPKVGWGDWYYSEVRSHGWTRPGSTVSTELLVPKDASGTLYQYRDDFIIKFYIHHWTYSFSNLPPVYTLSLSADDLNGYSNSSNKWCKFEVNWTKYNTVEVKRVYDLR